MASLDSDISADKEVNPYLTYREAKIARNEKRLKELGLWSAPKPQPIAIAITPTGNTPKKQKTIVYNGPVRRSGRLSTQTRPDYKDDNIPTNLGGGANNIISSGRKRHHTTALDEDTTTSSTTPIAKRVPSYTKKTTPSTPAANSVRSINLDVQTLLMGGNNNNSNGLLGRMVTQTGKLHVIEQSFSLAATKEDQDRLANTTHLSFNKYCGVQEWQNCIFLWVNLNSDSPNDFLDNAKQITWFGGSRMHDDSPVIHKLLKHGKKDATTTNKEDDAKIILWCRRYQPDVKKFTPYVCFGRLGYESHIPGSHPLSFVWNLLDYEGLKYHANQDVRDRFDLFTTS